MASDPRNKGNNAPAWRGGSKSTGQANREPSWRQGESTPPGTRERRVKQFLLGSGVIGVFVLMVILYLMWTLPPRPGIIAVGADPKDDASRLYVPLDLYGWASGKKLLAHFRGVNTEQTSWRWGRQVPFPHSEEPISLPDDPTQLQNWAAGFSHYDPIIIYFGLHGGGDEQGPYLFVGNGKAEENIGGKIAEPGEPRKVRVTELLNAFNTSQLAKRKKVFVFDPGRLTPDPIYGALQDDFAAKLKAINKEISNVPNLMVICGANSGERGWESEELQSTAVAQSLLETLRGDGKTDSALRNITGDVFFESVQKRTREWTSRNRSSQQDPFLLPDGKAGLSLAEQMIIVQLQRSGEAATPSEEGESPKLTNNLAMMSDADQASLTELWQQHDALAKSQPSPASYAPREWRLYRELLLRHEQAVRVGERATVNQLQATISQLIGQLQDAINPMTAAASRFNTLGGWTALNRKSPPPYRGLNLQLAATPVIPSGEEERASLSEALLELLINDVSAQEAESEKYADLLHRAAAFARQIPPESRPVEVHLPVMVDQFYYTLRQPPKAPSGPPPTGVGLGSPKGTPKSPGVTVPGLWAKAFGLRREAELAAFGLGDPALSKKRFQQDGPPDHYAERVWPLIRTQILEADNLRREVEDRLFLSDPKQAEELQAKLGQARQLLSQAATLATRVRMAMDVRDHLYADLPYLTIWAAEQEDSRIDPGSVKELWAKLHQLAREIDAPTTTAENWLKLQQSAIKLSQDYETIRSKLQNDLDEPLGNALSQALWDKKQLLLRLPLIGANQRQTILEHALRISRTLQSNPNQNAGTATGTNGSAAEQKRILKNRASYTISSISPEVLDHESVQLDLRQAALVSLWQELSSEADETKAMVIGNTLAKSINFHYRRLAQFTQGVPTPNANAINPYGEACSRQGIPYEPDLNWNREQAAINARLRWRELLQALARRVAVDHWYDERYDSDFADVSGPSTPGRYFRVQADRYLADAGRLAESLNAVITDPTLRPRAYPTPSDLPAILDLKPLAPQSQERILWTSELKRQIRFNVNVSLNPAIQGTAVGLRQQAEKSLFQPVDGGRTLYPLNLGNSEVLDITGDYFLTKTGQQNGEGTAEAVFYFRGQTPRCKVPLVLQSRPYYIMAEPLPDPSLQTYFAVRAERNLPRGSIAVVLDLSGSMKEGITSGVVLPDYKTNNNSKYRIAVDTLKSTLEQLPEGTRFTLRVFSDKETGNKSRLLHKGRVNWERDITPLTKIMDQIEALEPYSFTPLVKSLADCLAEDIDIDARTGSTILLITDGVEQDSGDYLSKEEITRRRDQLLTPMFTAEGPGAKVSLQVVNLGLSNAQDRELSELLFEKVEQHSTPSQIWDANDRQRLAKVLPAAVSPKLVLREVGSRLSPQGFPTGGWPSILKPRENAPTRAEDLRWSMGVSNEPLTATVSSAQSPSTYNLNVSRGDHMLLLLRAGPGNTIEIRRDLFADFFAPNLNRSYKNDNWSLTIPGSFILTNRAFPEFETVASIEKLPDYRRGDAADPDDNRKTIEHVVPPVMWWDVRPIQRNPNTENWDPLNLNEQAQTRVTRVYNRYAPSWNVKVKHWNQDLNGFPPAVVKSWVPTRLEVNRLAEIIPNRTGSQTVDLPLNRLEVVATIEDHVLESMPGREPKAERCLVLRCQHAYGRPVYARMRGLASAKNSEHHYFGKNSLDLPTPPAGNVPPAYTAYFWPITQREEEQVFNIEWFAIDPIRTAENLLKLEIPKPSMNTAPILDGRPVPTTDYKPRGRTER